MVSDNIIRTTISTIVLLCILDHILLPWDTQILSWILNGNWQGLTLFLVLEQLLILATRKMDWYTIIFQTLSAVSVQTYLQLNKESILGRVGSGEEGFSTVLVALAVLNATLTAGTVVLGSNISRTITCSRALLLKLVGLVAITAIKLLHLSTSTLLGKTPLIASCSTLKKTDFTLLTAFLFTRLFLGIFVQSMVVAVMKNGELRYIFQKVGIRGFDMGRLVPEVKGTGREKVLGDEEVVKGTGNLTFAVLGLWVTVTIIRGNF